ncbi:MAG: hypothetical protein PHO02_01050 [Candidatus Nanoarchaeia archaeon]|nr:hypothetical protein [Candidatus Nanoarchaeia archaeon]
MAVMDYVVPVTKIKQSLSFEIKDFYKMLKNWMKERGYEIEEKEYAESGHDNGHKTHFVWKCEKKMDSYTKIIIELNFIADTKDVVLEDDEKKKTLQEGNVSIAVGGYISKDIEDEWAMKVKTGFERFLRELYDKFGKGQKFEEYEGKLKKDIETIVYDIKTYLKMHRFD